VNIVSCTVTLTVADPAASSRFLTSHLGFRETLAGEDFVILGRDDVDAGIVLHQRDLEREPTSRGLADLVVSFAVTDIAAEYERLCREGATIAIPLRREPWGEWLVQLTDPNGVAIQLIEWIPPSQD
jgi:uncharacterized glyoxalase superfamily protein PhnB